MRLTLHDEIADILRKYDNRWTTCGEIAGRVNERDRYVREDGTPVRNEPMTSDQVSARINQYLEMFERDVSSKPYKVRLRNP